MRPVLPIFAVTVPVVTAVGWIGAELVGARYVCAIVAVHLLVLLVVLHLIGASLIHH